MLINTILIYIIFFSLTRINYLIYFLILNLNFSGKTNKINEKFILRYRKIFFYLLKHVHKMSITHLVQYLKLHDYYKFMN